jgi:hypothetical protein
MEKLHKTTLLVELCMPSFNEEHRLRVLRRIFGLRRDEVTGDWRKLYNEELRNLYSSPNIIRTIKSRRMRWAGLVAQMRETRNAFRLFVGKPNIPLGRPIHKWVDNIKMELNRDRMGWYGLDQTGSE